MKTSSLLGCLLVGHLGLAGCGDDTTTGGAGGGGSSAGGEAQGGEAQGGEAQGGEAQGGEAPSGGAGEGGAGDGLLASVEDVALFGNCKPEIGADPLGGSFTANYNRGTTDSSTTITSVQLELTGIDATLTWTFDVDPEASGVIPGGQSIDVLHTKVADSGSGDKGDITPCGYCGASAVLTVTWDDGAGATQEASVSYDDFPCAL